MELLSIPSSLLTVGNATCMGLAVAVLFLLIFWVKNKKGHTYPPGPSPLPVVGNTFQLDFNNLPESLSQLSRQYGNVFSLQIFFEDSVVLNGYEAIKEGLVTKSEDTADRPSIPMFEHLGMNTGIAFTGYGQRWKEQRRFALQTLRNFGMGKKSMEEHIREEAAYMCSAFQANEGRPFDPFMVITNAVSNVICSIIFGDRFEYSDSSFQKMIYLLKELAELETKPITQFYKIFPWLMKVPGPHQKLFSIQSTYLDFLRAIIQKHRDTWDPAVRRDFIDTFFEEIEKNKDNPSSSFTEETLLIVMADLFVAGTDTTSNTLRWSLLMMLLHPHIQKKVHEEIDRVIVSDRLPSVEDQPNMPYTTAVIHEVQRFGNILPMALLHMTYRNTNIQGYDIPKGTTIIPNLTSVLKDKNIWKKPHQFYPEHFLDSEGKFVKNEAFIPFSAGRRICVGEQLARMDLFIFFTSLLQHFEFHIPDDQPYPRHDPVFTFNYSPHPFQVCCKER
ncbi:cytochrome P450 2D15-like isoform X1 [Hyla sarda]|uniref:cytochrome P450 2D15-like isoform X1 n=2 Tax=Hyla sarda TaxID=327740 RepID=UPI0024C31281|nr:cytochrome P450 2D15-like isoform X1 [Hyla sarda]